MITVIHPQSIDAEKALRKWSPILQNMNIHKSLYGSLSMYCDVHALNESYQMGSIGFSPVKTEINTLLPEAIKLISLLNLKGKNVQVAMGPTFQYIDENRLYRQGTIKSVEMSTPLAKTDMRDATKVREDLLKELANNINKQLEEYDTIVMYNMVASIATMANATEAPKISLISRYVMLDEINGETNDTEQSQDPILSKATNEQLMAELTNRLNIIKQQL